MKSPQRTSRSHAFFLAYESAGATRFSNIIPNLTSLEAAITFAEERFPGNRGGEPRHSEARVDLTQPNLIRVWTIGHSTRSMDDFVEALASQKITTLVDVRSFPSSKRLPHFNQSALSETLAEAGIAYLHLRELGGRRRARKDSHNTAWQNEGFRGYADYMETEFFREGIEKLLESARTDRMAIMCAEALWWRCHRSLIADYLTSKGVVVAHILSATKTEPHRYTSPARIINGELSYRGLF